jgi:hypothetical protein
MANRIFACGWGEMRKYDVGTVHDRIMESNYDPPVNNL